MLLQSLVHGVITMEQLSPLYGAERRRLRIAKLRGIRYRGGYHDFTIAAGGLRVFPRLVAAEHHTGFEAGAVQSGVPALDALFGGGPDRGSSLLLIGPSGCGKSTVAFHYAAAAATRGERAAVFSFDESATAFRARAASLGLGLEAHVLDGRVAVRQVDPAELSPGEFSHAVREEAETGGARVVVIDSLNGYLNAMPEERFLALQLHELLMYLAQRGVLTVLTVAQTGLAGAPGESPVDVSYLADSVLLFRYGRPERRVVKTLSVVKKRTGVHATTLHELTLDGGLRIGPPLDRSEAGGVQD
ncbi:MAG: ATPase domain-containing protein [Anaeromyxobacteraceae bacterium]